MTDLVFVKFFLDRIHVKFNEYWDNITYIATTENLVADKIWWDPKSDLGATSKAAEQANKLRESPKIERQRKIARCDMILEGKLDQSAIDALKKEISQKKKEIARQPKKDQQKSIKDLLLLQQKLDLATKGAKEYQDLGCKDLIGKDY